MRKERNRGKQREGKEEGRERAIENLSGDIESLNTQGGEI